MSNVTESQMSKSGLELVDQLKSPAFHCHTISLSNLGETGLY